MTNLYLIRYSEIGLKGPRARSIMERYLLDNISSSLKNLGSARLFKSIGRFLLETDIPEEIITEKLKRIFGVRSFSPVVKDDFNSPDEIASRCLSLFGDSLTGKKFAIRCRRTGTHNFSS
ncbi:MAG: THUMP domain-containing protein, partial [Candidatus Thermoplasmatota archaeon]|nr:THUMP domain-containing protein [Candidatus Thermoplasmatota archaeon]